MMEVCKKTPNYTFNQFPTQVFDFYSNFFLISYFDKRFVQQMKY